VLWQLFTDLTIALKVWQVLLKFMTWFRTQAVAVIFVLLTGVALVACDCVRLIMAYRLAVWYPSSRVLAP